jgi:aryl-alcohol dehydrogenase
VMAAALTPATRIVAVDRVPERLALAREVGATDTIDATQGNVAEAVRALTGGAGADGVLETTGNPTVLRSGVDALAARGTLVVIGAPPFGTEVGLDVNGMLPGRTVVGITLGDSETQGFIPTLVALVRSGRLPIDKLIEQYRFEDVAQAIEDVHSGKTIKPVLLFD